MKPAIHIALLGIFLASIALASEQSVRSSDGRLNLNTAPLADLELLPGVGPDIARRIIDARPFKSVTDLRKVKGIGPKAFEQLEGYVFVE